MGFSLKRSLKRAVKVVKQSNDPRRTTDPRKVWADSKEVTGDELANWSPSAFGGMSKEVQQKQAREDAANELALQGQADDVYRRLQGINGASTPNNSAMRMGFTSPAAAPNGGLPMMGGNYNNTRADFGNFLSGLRQNMPATGYSPVMPRLQMLPPAPAVPPSIKPQFDPNLIMNRAPGFGSPNFSGTIKSGPQIAPPMPGGMMTNNMARLMAMRGRGGMTPPINPRPRPMEGLL